MVATDRQQLGFETTDHNFGWIWFVQQLHHEMVIQMIE
jgi:hypothetical protein